MKGTIMKPGKLARTTILTILAIITLSSLTGCIVAPARPYYYGGPVVVHAWVR
jgi:hypothetical protein